MWPEHCPVHRQAYWQHAWRLQPVEWFGCVIFWRWELVIELAPMRARAWR